MNLRFHVTDPGDLFASPYRRIILSEKRDVWCRLALEHWLASADAMEILRQAQHRDGTLDRLHAKRAHEPLANFSDASVHDRVAVLATCANGLSSVDIDADMKERLATIAIDVFTACVNGGKTFQDALLAVYLTGLENGSTAATPGGECGGD